MVMSIGWNPYYKNEVRSVVCTLLFNRSVYLSLDLPIHVCSLPCVLYSPTCPLRASAKSYLMYLSLSREKIKANPPPNQKEVHIMHTFAHDFYGARMNLLICGFIRPEYDYVSKESLIEDINVDIEVARRSLEREAYLELKGEDYLMEFGGEGHEGEVAS